MVGWGFFLSAEEEGKEVRQLPLGVLVLMTLGTVVRSMRSFCLAWIIEGQSNGLEALSFGLLSEPHYFVVQVH